MCLSVCLFVCLSVCDLFVLYTALVSLSRLWSSIMLFPSTPLPLASTFVHLPPFTSGNTTTRVTQTPVGPSGGRGRGWSWTAGRAAGREKTVSTYFCRQIPS